jgi:putative oxidoreductase
MRRFLSYSASPAVTSLAIFILRVAFGSLILLHGYDKALHFAALKEKFMSFLGMSPAISLGLVVFAEFVCAIFLIVGLLTRFACIPLITTMAVAVFMAHGGDITGEGEHPTLFLVGFITILFTGAGKYSLDAVLYKH